MALMEACVAFGHACSPCQELVVVVVVVVVVVHGAALGAALGADADVGPVVAGAWATDTSFDCG